MRVFAGLMAAGMLGCGADSGDTGASESPASNFAGDLVRLRIEINVGVPDEQRANLQVRINGGRQEIVDMPIDPRSNGESRGAAGEPSEAPDEADGVAAIRPAKAQYRTLIPWLPGEMLFHRVEAVEAATGEVLAELTGFGPPPCSEDPPPPLEIFEKVSLYYLPEREGRPWALGSTGDGCLYEDSERNRETDGRPGI